MTKRLLIVDDEVALARALARLLKRAGYEIITANDGEEGLECANEFPPDLIITDVRMPRMSGIEMMNEFRRSDKRTPCIILSGHHDHSPMEIEQLGCAIALTKPMQIGLLLEEIEKMFERCASLAETTSEPLPPSAL